ncbi:hypothetical protein VTO42DRAFT_4297 [Malbranchea cinnamomea]
MESTRVFVSGLPPTLTNDGLRKHFSGRFEVTDAHVIPSRRIGFVGFKSGSAAQEAVKYFNKTYIRMSKIAVELARPINADPVDTRSRNKGQPDRTISSKDNSNKRKRDPKDEEDDPELQEFLAVMQPSSKSKTWADSGLDATTGISSSVANSKSKNDPVGVGAEPPVKAHNGIKRLKSDTDTAVETHLPVGPEQTLTAEPASLPDAAHKIEEAPQSDADWLRSKTSRLLGLVDEEDEADGPSRLEANGISPSDEESTKGNETEAAGGPNDNDQSKEIEPPDANIQMILNTGRLFVRNLSYDTTEKDLEPVFSRFGKIEEIHVAFDTRHSSSKGFAYVQYFDPDAAVEAYKELDGKDFQGRLLHILPATAKKTYKLDEVELSKLPLKKQQQIKRKAEAGKSTWSWNSLYMNADAIMSSVAQRLGVSKADILDPTSSDAAVKQAHAETHVIQETKAYFSANGVNLESFKHRERGNTAILVKNFSYGVTVEDLRKLFEPYGQITRLLMPPSGTIAIVAYAMPDEAQRAFKALAYRKLGDSILFLEKAPKDLFEGGSTTTTTTTTTTVEAPKVVSQGFSTSDLLQADEPETPVETSTLFVRNLNFSTTDEGLAAVFKPLDGFLSAKVKTKVDPKRPGQRLSMGFGFVEFRTRAQAQAALAAMNGYRLDQHELVIKPSHKGLDIAEERRRDDNAKKLAGRRTKIIIKNLPFQATKKDVRALFGAYGQLRSVRVPKKFDRSSRGFAFADFTSAREAENAMDALRNTHLLGRRLVLEYASEEAIDPEEEIKKMEKKVDAQVNKVKLKQLTGGGRKKFHVDAVDDA